MKEEQLLAEAKAEELKDKLDQLAAESSGEDPAKTWEALDHLADSVEKAAKDAAASAATKQEQLEKAEALAEGLMAGADQMDARLMTEAMQTLSAMIQGAMKENEALEQKPFARNAGGAEKRFAQAGTVERSRECAQPKPAKAEPADVEAESIRPEQKQQRSIRIR